MTGKIRRLTEYHEQSCIGLQKSIVTHSGQATLQAPGDSADCDHVPRKTDHETSRTLRSNQQHDPGDPLSSIPLHALSIEQRHSCPSASQTFKAAFGLPRRRTGNEPSLRQAVADADSRRTSIHAHIPLRRNDELVFGEADLCCRKGSSWNRTSKSNAGQASGGARRSTIIWTYPLFLPS